MFTIIEWPDSSQSHKLVGRSKPPASQSQPKSVTAQTEKRNFQKSPTKWIREMEIILLVYMTKALIGNRVAAEKIGNGIWKVFYRNILLGYFNEKNIREKEKSTRLSTNRV